jgi:hypothetical protein
MIHRSIKMLFNIPSFVQQFKRHLHYKELHKNLHIFLKKEDQGNYSPNGPMLEDQSFKNNMSSFIFMLHFIES